MISRLFDEDPIAGRRRIFHFDPNDSQVTLETRQDVEEIVEANKALHNYHDERTPWKGEWHRVASIPLNVLADLKAKGILGDPKAFRAWLNDRDNLAFRTRPGRV